MKATLITFGSYGDFAPFHALGVGLRSAGHEVRMVTNSHYRPIVEEADLDLVAIEADPIEVLESPAGRYWMDAGRSVFKLTHGLRTVVKPWLEAGVRAAEKAIAGADVILASWLAIGLIAPAASARRVPLVPAYLQPVSPTRDFASPFLPPGRRWLPPRTQRLSHRIAERLVWAALTGNAVSATFGAPYRRIERAAPLLLYGFSPTLLPPPADWTGPRHVVGFWSIPPRWQPPPALVEFLAAGQPPVCVTFGSMVLADRAATAAALLRAAKPLRQRVLFLGPWPELQNVQGDDVAVVDGLISHDWLLPRTSLVVHHAGAGTSGAVLRAGRVSLPLPVFADQWFWADRLVRLGVAPGVLGAADVDHHALTKALEAALEPGRQSRATAVAAEAAREDGVGRSVELIESIDLRRWSNVL